MYQPSTGHFKKQETVGQAFSHSCLGRLVIMAAIMLAIIALAIMSKPSEKEMEKETIDNIMQCIQANDSIRGDKIDDTVNNLTNAFTKADTAKVNIELRKAYFQHNRIEVYNHIGLRTAYVFNNVHPEGVRVGFGIFGLVFPTVTYEDLLLNVDPIQREYKDGVIQVEEVPAQDLGSNPNITEFHYEDDPDQ
jgi:hypothetical protein